MANTRPGLRNVPLPPAPRRGTADAGDQPLVGCDILIVEDEFLVAMEIEDAVTRMGATVTMVGSRAGALDALERARPDGVLLDVQLRDEMSYEVADRLVGAGIPFIFTTGFDRSILPEHLQGQPRLTKPFAPAELRKLAVRVFAAKS